MLTLLLHVSTVVVFLRSYGFSTGVRAVGAPYAKWFRWQCLESSLPHLYGQSPSFGSQIWHSLGHTIVSHIFASWLNFYSISLKSEEQVCQNCHVDVEIQVLVFPCVLNLL